MSPCQSRRFQNLALFLPSGKVFGKNAPIARLAGYLNNPNTEEGGKCIKEVIIVRAYKVVHVYNVVEIGRRYFRSLCYTSNIRHCLHDIKSDRSLLKQWGRAVVEGGNPLSYVRAEKSLVVTRHLNAREGVQTFVPTFVLNGLIPSVLLSEYSFWQREDGSITGYSKTMSKNGHQSKSLLHITLFPDKGSSDSTGFGNATASALIHRSEVDHLIKSDEMFDDGNNISKCWKSSCAS